MNRLDPTNCAVWSAMAAFVISFWVAVAVYGIPAARAIVSAASAGPTACAHVAKSDRTACVMEGW